MLDPGENRLDTAQVLSLGADGLVQGMMACGHSCRDARF